MKSLLSSLACRVISAVLLICSQQANAAEVRFGSERGEPFYVLDGPIVPGDAQKLVDLIKSDLYTMSYAEGLLVDSPGGDIAEAIKIAEVVERYWLRVEVSEDGECSSACFFVYVGSPSRGPRGSVRIHAPYYDLSDVDATRYADYAGASRQVHEATRSFLLARSVPSRLIERMLSLPSTSAYTLTIEDKVDVGFESPFAREIGTQKCGGIRSDGGMTKQEVHSYVSCTMAAYREARLAYVWGNNSKAANSALNSLGQAWRDRVLSSPNHSFEEKLRMQDHLAAIVTKQSPDTWVETEGVQNSV